MSMTLNGTYHWQLPDGRDLYSGDQIELYVNQGWVSGRVEYKPQKQYMLILDNGQEWPITEKLILRALESKWMT